MKILALETSAKAASAALMDEEKLIGEYTVNDKMTHSQTIMPMVEELLKRTGTDRSELEYIAIAEGPGSFTGLRIGAATAKGLAYGLGIPLVPVPTLEALAYNIFDTENIICPIMDARRQQVYTGFFAWEKGTLCEKSTPGAWAIEKVRKTALEFGKKVIFLGDGVPVHKKLLQEEERFLLAPSHLSIQKAGSVAKLALKKIEEKKAIDGSLFSPVYFRKPQAERELEERKAHLEEKNV